MKKLFLLVVLSALFVSCTSSEIEKPEANPSIIAHNEVLELIDVRIYEDGALKINGTLLSESSLESHLDALDVNSETKVRISSSDMVYTGLVNRISSELVQRDLDEITFNMMSPEAFQEFENDIVIDILSNEKVMLDGNVLYPEDIAVAMDEWPKNSGDIEVRLNVADEALMGTVTVVQSILKEKAVSKITYSTSPS
ncbi:hypothetical protein [Gracilimonas sp.]|uniref:hypothetical protein n=1 Tax=Gracilimonas sp. TaxID=1974203 RepID=UPI002870B98C|nr:hypothetical protein [Gracilimonas sp.]